MIRGQRQMLRTDAEQPPRSRRRPVASHDQPIVAGADRNHALLSDASLHDHRQQIGASEKLRGEPVGGRR